MGVVAGETPLDTAAPYATLGVDAAFEQFAVFGNVRGIPDIFGPDSELLEIQRRTVASLRRDIAPRVHFR